jgi:membrane fusion protein (multidrug efflux system)
MPACSGSVPKIWSRPAPPRWQRATSGVADEKNANGAVVRADANLKTAQINLDYTTISAPIAGRTGRALATKGNLVGPDSGPLALIVSQDPMFATFPVSQREFLRIRPKGGNTSRENVLVKIRFEDVPAYDQMGRMIVRARVPNPNSVLVADQFVQVSVVGETFEEKVVIPQATLIADQEGPYVESGIAPGDLVVVNGTQNLRPGAAVAATPIPETLKTGQVKTEG